MKRILSLLLSITLVVSAFALGVPLLAEEEKDVDLDLDGRKIRMAAWWDLTPVEGEDEQTDQLIERYAQMEEDYNFEWEYVMIPWEDYQRTYITNSMAGDAIADLALVEDTWFYPNLALNNFLTDVSDLGTADFTEDKWNQDVLELTTINGKIMGFDTGRTFPTGVLFWNKTMFEREGLPSIYDDFFAGEWTWDKMTEYAKALTKDTDGDGEVDQWGIGGPDFTSAMVFSNGGETVDLSDPENPKFALLSDEALTAFQKVQDLTVNDKVVFRNPEGAEWDFQRVQFINGNLGMFVGAWYMVDSMVESMEDEYGVVLFPKGPDADQYVSRSGAVNLWTIPETCDIKDEAMTIFDLRTDPLPDELEDDWKIYFEDRVTDSESVDVIEMLQDEGLTKIDNIANFNGVVELSYTYHDQIETGEETPLAAISAIADQAQNLIDTAMKKDPAELVEELTPEDEEADAEAEVEEADDAETEDSED